MIVVLTFVGDIVSEFAWNYIGARARCCCNISIMLTSPAFEKVRVLSLCILRKWHDLIVSSVLHCRKYVTVVGIFVARFVGARFRHIALSCSYKALAFGGGPASSARVTKILDKIAHGIVETMYLPTLSMPINLYWPGPGTACFLASSSGSYKLVIRDLSVYLTASEPMLLFVYEYVPGPGLSDSLFFFGDSRADC